MCVCTCLYVCFRVVYVCTAHVMLHVCTCVWMVYGNRSVREIRNNSAFEQRGLFPYMAAHTWYPAEWDQMGIEISNTDLYMSPQKRLTTLGQWGSVARVSHCHEHEWLITHATRGNGKEKEESWQCWSGCDRRDAERERGTTWNEIMMWDGAVQSEVFRFKKMRYQTKH